MNFFLSSVWLLFFGKHVYTIFSSSSANTLFNILLWVRDIQQKCITIWHTMIFLQTALLWPPYPIFGAQYKNMQSCCVCVRVCVYGCALLPCMCDFFLGISYIIFYDYLRWFLMSIRDYTWFLFCLNTENEIYLLWLVYAHNGWIAVFLCVLFL